MEWVGESEVTSAQLKKSTDVILYRYLVREHLLYKKTEPTEYQMTQVYMC